VRRFTQYIDAYGFILLRVSGAMLYFGCLGCLCRRKNSSLTIFRIIAAAFFGVAFNMLTFLRVELTSLSRHP
jgi:hypothetical protein